MDWKVFSTAFLTLFFAELGDKTQLAALGLTAESKKPMSVLAGGVLGLALVTLLAVLAGQALSAFIPERLIRRLAALTFVAAGIFLWFRGSS